MAALVGVVWEMGSLAHNTPARQHGGGSSSGSIQRCILSLLVCIWDVMFWLLVLEMFGQPQWELLLVVTDLSCQ